MPSSVCNRNATQEDTVVDTLVEGEALVWKDLDAFLRRRPPVCRPHDCPRCHCAQERARAEPIHALAEIKAAAAPNPPSARHLAGIENPVPGQRSSRRHIRSPSASNQTRGPRPTTEKLESYQRAPLPGTKEAGASHSQSILDMRMATHCNSATTSTSTDHLL